MSRPARRPTRWGPLGLVTLALAACGQAPPPSPDPGTLPRFSVDPALTPRPATLPPDLAGERPLVSARDGHGRVSIFVGDEVILAPRDEAELAAFLARTGGTVIESNAVSGVPGQPGGAGATEYTIRLGPAGTAPDTLATDAAGLGLRGETTLSSEGTRRLLALVAREVRAGTRLGLNLVLDPAGEMLPGTGEAAGACGSPTANAFDCAVFQSTGSRASVTQAWQFLAAHGITRRVRVAIIDSGFWLDQNNVPDPSADLPPILDAHDFHNGDGTAGGQSTKCEGQKAGQPGCLWHGHNSASVAMGVLNNGLGVAGTGGQVADALLYKWGFTKSSLRAAVARARVAGADVISISVRGTCNDVCAKLNGLTDEFALAVEAGSSPSPPRATMARTCRTASTPAPSPA